MILGRLTAGKRRVDQRRNHGTASRGSVLYLRPVYQEIIPVLRRAYDQSAARRDTESIAPWKEAERAAFGRLLQREGRRRLLEIGAGPGNYAARFRDEGFDVVCTDLSPEMVALCRVKGLEAYEKDFLALDFADGSFDAVFALNCLLHVPKANLPQVLANLRRVLRPSGLLFFGVYGGQDFEGVWEDDQSSPRRFFALYTDDDLLAAVSPFFEPVSFRSFMVQNQREDHFQSLVARRA